MNHAQLPGSEQLQSALREVSGERYKLVARLGSGAHGVVYRAVDTRLDRTVAIKQVRLDHFADPTQADEMRRRTAREAKMAAKLRHPGIVAIHDVVHTATSTLLFMEFVDGVSTFVTARSSSRTPMPIPIGSDSFSFAAASSTRQPTSAQPSS